MGGQTTYEYFKDSVGNYIKFHVEPLLDNNLFNRQYWHRYIRPEGQYWYRYILPRRLRELKADILFSPGGLVPRFLPRGIKTVSMNQNILPFMFSEAKKDGLMALIRRMAQRYFQLNSYRRANGVIFLSEFSRSIVGNIYPSVFQKSIVIPHGVNRSFFRNVTKGRWKTENKVELLYVSTIKSHKYQWNIVKAMFVLHREGYTNISLKLVGPADSGPLKKLESTIEKYKMRDNIQWLGVVPHEKIAEIYHNASIFIFPSTCEACPNILLEAMASGLPIACSDRASMPEFAKDGVKYIDPEDPNSIATAITYLINNSEDRRKLSLRALELSKSYTWGNCATKTFDFICRVGTDYGGN